MAVDTESGVILRVGSTELSKWQSFAIESDILTPADAFNFRATNKGGEFAGLINPGDRVEVTVDGSKQMVGYVDDVICDCDEGGAFLDITGRDLFLFLVDCSAPAISLHNLTLKQLAERLTASWIDSWEVDSTITLPRVKKMKIEPGDSPLEVLQRFCEQAKVTMWLSPDGAGIIGKPNYNQPISNYLYRCVGASPYGNLNNIIRGPVTRTWREQFSTVTVGGSTANTKNIFGSGSSKFKAQALDGTVPIARPKNISSGNVANTKQAKILADETVQKGQFESLKLEYTVAGFYNNNLLWAPDTLCAVKDEIAGIDDIYYLTRRRFYNDGQGNFTDIELHKKGVWLP